MNEYDIAFVEQLIAGGLVQLARAYAGKDPSVIRAAEESYAEREAIAKAWIKRQRDAGPVLVDVGGYGVTQ